MLRYDHIIVNYQGKVYYHSNEDFTPIFYHFLKTDLVNFVSFFCYKFKVSLFCPTDMGLSMLKNYHFLKKKCFHSNFKLIQQLIKVEHRSPMFTIQPKKYLMFLIMSILLVLEITL